MFGIFGWQTRIRGAHGDCVRALGRCLLAARADARRGADGATAERAHLLVAALGAALRETQ